MIQRIQTIYLCLVIILTAILFVLLPATDILAFIYCGIAAAVAIVAIFLYKKRKLQMIVVSGLSCILLLILLWILIPMLRTEGFYALKNIIFYIPLLALLLNILAFRAIYKDEKLVRSLDRLR